MKIEPIKLLKPIEELRDYYQNTASAAAGTVLAPSALFLFKAARNAIAALMRIQDLGASIVVIDNDMVGIPSTASGKLYFVRKNQCSCQARVICKHLIMRDAAVAFAFGEDTKRI